MDKIEAYPKIYVTGESYYVLSECHLYKISKADLKIEQMQLERPETPLITKEDTLFLRQGKFLTLVQNDNNDKKILRLEPQGYISGWGIEGKTVIISRRDAEEMVSLKEKTRLKLRTPSYGTLDVVDNMGHLAIIQFSHTGGKVPMFDPALTFYSLIDWTDYWYYHPYLYDAEQNKFYDIPDEIKQLYSSKYVELTGYCAPINLKLIETEFYQYLDN